MDPEAQRDTPWYRSTLAVATIGSVLLWAALPPLAIGWLGWFAPVPWLLLVQSRQLPGRRPYHSLYLAGLAFWLAAIHWLRLPHPLVYFGWIALSGYLAIYVPLFVGLSRVGVHRLGLPMWLVSPVVWAGLELARAHVMTGFMMGSLAHTQVDWPTVIQIADFGGEYLVDMLIVLVAAGVAQLIPISSFGLQMDSPLWGSQLRHWKFTALSLLPGCVALIAALAYGHWRLNDNTVTAGSRTARIALIQGNSLADWKLDAEKQRDIMNEYIRLSHEAVAKARATGDGRPLDLVVWPETMFRVPLWTFDPDVQLPVDVTQTKEQLAAAGPESLARLAQTLNAPILVGIDRQHFGLNAKADPDGPLLPTATYNSAALVNRDGKLLGTYDKHHLVMFGEYVPFARWLPFLNRITTVTGSVDAGDGPAPMHLNGVVYAPNICYETVIPHVIRRHAAATSDDERRPDILVNLTNDAWYWGSNELDQHLACGVFRVIETRRPLVIAANGGISAWIDTYGRIRAQAPKMQPDVIIADVQSATRGDTLYVKSGDWMAGACLFICVALALVGWRGDRRALSETKAIKSS
jgi:apolipoprotein N-acyltransferase